MNVGGKIKHTMCPLIIIIGFFCACSLQKEPRKLTKEQKASVEIICQNVDKWSGEYLDSGQYWPVNHVYLSELDDGTTLMTVGYLGEPKGAGMTMRIFLGFALMLLPTNFIFMRRGINHLNGLHMELILIWIVCLLRRFKKQLNNLILCLIIKTAKINFPRMYGANRFLQARVKFL